MPEWNPIHEAVTASYSLASAIIVLFVGWFVGARLTYSWNLRQRRDELRLSALQLFYSAYGEFFATWKLWNSLGSSDEAFGEKRWELYKRAASAEAFFEGALVKLSSEWAMGEEQVICLGCFRQAIQQLREAIREHRGLYWGSSDNPEYEAFKILAINVSSLIAAGPKGNAPDASDAARAFLTITSNKWEGNWAVNPCTTSAKKR